MSLTVVAILYTAPGKTARVLDLLRELAIKVEKQEPGTLQYQIHEEVGKPDGEIIMLESYADKEALKTHGSSADFKTFFGQCKKEGLFSKAASIYTIKPAGGFASRL